MSAFHVCTRFRVSNRQRQQKAFNCYWYMYIKLFYFFHLFHFVLQYLIHMDFVNDDWVVMVERTKLAMMESLPMAMQQKKFGTWGKCLTLCIVNFKASLYVIEKKHPILSKTIGSCYMSCMHSKFEGLIMMKHALINALCNMCFTELSHLRTVGVMYYL